MVTKYIKNDRAQVISEYAIMLALVVVVMIAMSTYIKRALQGRIHDAKNTAMEMIRTETGEDVLNEYEPYYLQQNSTVSRAIHDEAALSAGWTSGVFNKTYDEEISIHSESAQLPALNAD